MAECIHVSEVEVDDEGDAKDGSEMKPHAACMPDMCLRVAFALLDAYCC